VTYYDVPRVAPATLATAKIQNQGMIDYIGVSEFTVNFNLGAWVPMQGVDAHSVDVYLLGANAQQGASYVNDKPIMVKFDYGKGSVIYTSFHNEAGLTGDAVKALEYMVLLSIMSRSAAELADEFRAQGFIPTKENIGIVPIGGTTNFTYTHATTHDEDVAFGTRWRDTANVTLDVNGPGGASGTASGGTPSLLVQFTGGANGAWTYGVRNNAASGDLPIVVMSAKRIAAFNSVDYVKVYPNPYKATDHDVVVFEGLTQEATIKIYTISGQLVKTIHKNDGSGTAFWSVDNDSGQKVATGLYLWSAEGSSGSMKRGKVAVIQ
jgi:hypothetical protein